jgi:hypothetical protein
MQQHNRRTGAGDSNVQGDAVRVDLLIVEYVHAVSLVDADERSMSTLRWLGGVWGAWAGGGLGRGAG